MNKTGFTKAFSLLYAIGVMVLLSHVALSHGVGSWRYVAVAIGWLVFAFIKRTLKGTTLYENIVNSVVSIMTAIVAYHFVGALAFLHLVTSDVTSSNVWGWVSVVAALWVVGILSYIVSD